MYSFDWVLQFLTPLEKFRANEKCNSCLMTEEHGVEALTPLKVVELLDRYIVGQQEAKRAVAVALRMLV